MDMNFMQKNEADCTLSQRLSDTRGLSWKPNCFKNYPHATLEIVFWTNFYSVRCNIFFLYHAIFETWMRPILRPELCTIQYTCKNTVNYFQNSGIFYIFFCIFVKVKMDILFMLHVLSHLKCSIHQVPKR